MTDTPTPDLTPRSPADVIKVLESGRYAQADGALFEQHRRPRPSAYCCLGVMAAEIGIPDEVMAEHGFITHLHRYEDGEFERQFRAAYPWCTPGADWQSCDDPYEGSVEHSLAEANDDDESGKFEGPIRVLRNLANEGGG